MYNPFLVPAGEQPRAPSKNRHIRGAQHQSHGDYGHQSAHKQHQGRLWNQIHSLPAYSGSWTAPCTQKEGNQWTEHSSSGTGFTYQIKGLSSYKSSTTTITTQEQDILPNQEHRPWPA